MYWTRRTAASKKQRMKQTRKRVEMRIEVLQDQGGRSTLILGSWWWWWWCSKAIRGSRSPSSWFLLSDLEFIVEAGPRAMIVQDQLKMKE